MDDAPEAAFDAERLDQHQQTDVPSRHPPTRSRPNKEPDDVPGDDRGALFAPSTNNQPRWAVRTHLGALVVVQMTGELEPR